MQAVDQGEAMKGVCGPLVPAGLRGGRAAAVLSPASRLHLGAGWRWTIGVAAAAVVGLRFGVSWSTPGLMVWAAGLGLLVVSDLERMILPKRQVYLTLVVTLSWLVLAAGLHGSWGRLGGALLAAVAVEGLFGALWLAWPGSLGFGDVRLVGVIGLGVGWVSPTLVAVSVSAGLMAAGVVALVGVTAGRLSRRSRLPVGALLAVAGVVTVMLG